jgi:hypothetical protein
MDAIADFFNFIREQQEMTGNESGTQKNSHQRTPTSVTSSGSAGKDDEGEWDPLEDALDVLEPRIGDYDISGSSSSGGGNSARLQGSNGEWSLSSSPEIDVNDYAIMLELSHVNASSVSQGTYVLPAVLPMDFFEWEELVGYRDTTRALLREWHGLLFISQGIYKGGIFKFILTFPIEYPHCPPLVRFISTVYHPLVDLESGEVDISIGFPSWTAGKVK